jgi:AcrR family transcriptional regulator
VAADIGVTSATVIHHFGDKERLYGRVLERMATSIDTYIGHFEGESVEAVVSVFERFLDWSFDNQHYAQLLLRELMENRSRLPRARRFHLLSQIAKYVERISEGQRAGRFRHFDTELFVFYTLGAITHFSAAAPTVDRMVSDSDEETVSRFRSVLRDNVTLMLTLPASEKPRGRASQTRARN